MKGRYSELIKKTFGHYKYEFRLPDVEILLDAAYYDATQNPWKHRDKKLPEDGDSVLVIMKGDEEPLKAKFYTHYLDFGTEYINCFVSIFTGNALDGVEYWMLVPTINKGPEKFTWKEIYPLEDNGLSEPSNHL